MNIIPFSTEVTYTAPDYELIKLNIGKMLQQNAEAEFAFNETKYLPSIHTKARGLHTSIVQAKRNIDESLDTLKTVSAKALSNLNKYRAQATEELTDDEIEANTYAREQTIITFKKAYAPAVDAIQQQYKALADVKFDPALTTTYKDALQADLTQLNTALAAIDAEAAALENSRTIINDAMAVLEKGNFVDIAKDTLITAESISALGLVAPQVEIIKFAIEHMKKTLENIGEALNYLTMYEQRELLVSKIKALKPKQADYAAQVKTISSKTKLIVSIHGLFENFFGARAEYSKVEQSISAFADLMAVTKQADYEDRLVAAAPSLVAYLNIAR